MGKLLLSREGMGAGGLPPEKFVKFIHSGTLECFFLNKKEVMFIIDLYAEKEKQRCRYRGQRGHPPLLP